MSDQRAAGQLEHVVLDVVKKSKSWTAGRVRRSAARCRTAGF
jgi:hypothetical protein